MDMWLLMSTGHALQLFLEIILTITFTVMMLYPLPKVSDCTRVCQKTKTSICNFCFQTCTIQLPLKMLSFVRV
eukprot:6292330-Ditylum_brightwellii.AAC.1